MTVTYILLLAIIGCLGLIMSTPHISEANWAGSSSGTDACLKCHGTAHSSATINVAIDQVETTSASIDNDGVDSIEIDWMFEGASWTSNKESVGVMLAVPTGWSVVNGTANSPSLTNWSSQWDNVDGGLSWTYLIDPASDCPANHECYAVHFTSPWDHDTAGEDMACNLGSSACETGLSDQDGVQSRMGTDAIVKTNPGVQAGSYTVLVYGIGYDGTGRAHKSQTINVTVNDSGTVSAGSPATIADDNSNGGTVSWNTPGNAAAQDNAYAYVANLDTETSDYLKATNFGFAIPGGATIQGIIVDLDRNANNSNAISDTEVKIVKNSVIGSQNKAAGGFWPTSDTNTYQSYGGSNDTWGETWTPADINSANFGVAISVSDNGAKTDAYIDHIRITVFYSSGGNTAPDAPADHAQYRSDGSTAINEGWTTNETTVTVKATVSDTDADNVKLEVEIIDNAGAYTGTPNCSSGFVTSGSVATATCSGLTDGVSYKWRARTNDNEDTSAWQTFGAGDPDVTVKSEMDFGVDAVANTNPDDPINLAQYRSNGSTTIASGGYTEELTVVIEADISDPDGGDTVKLQVDINSDGASDCESTLGANPGTNVQVSCSVTDGISYNWQVRTGDDKGAFSSWVAFAGSPDFTVDDTAPSYTWNTPAAGTYYKDGDAISIDVSVTDTGVGINDGEDCDPRIDGNTSGFTGSVTYSLASGKCVGTITLNTPSSITDGAHNLTVRMADKLANNSISPDRSINIDNSPPSGLGNSSPADGATDQSTSVNVVASTATDSGSGSVQYYFEVAEDAGFSTGLQQSGWQAGTSYAPTLANSTTYYWHVKARDALGNETSYTATWDFATSTPNTAPDDPTGVGQYRSDGTTVIAQGGYTEESSIIIKATVDDGDAQDVSIEAEIVLNSGAFTGTANCTGGTAVTVPGVAQVTCSGLSEGNYKWRVRAYDGIDYSNWVTYGGNPDVRIDQTAPAYTWNQPIVPNYFTDGNTLTVDVTITEAGAGITNGADCNPKIDGATTEFTGTVTYSTVSGKCTGTLTIDDPSSLTDGPHNLTVEVADDLGNTQQSANRVIGIDNTAPSYTWNTPAAGTYYKDGDTISVDVTITEAGEGITNGADCNAKINGATSEFTGSVTYSAISGKCTGTLTINNPSSLSDSAHSLTVEVADDLGNTQQSAARSINIDNTAPSGLSNSSPADGATDVLLTSNVTANAATDSGSGSVQYYFELAEDAGFSAGLQQSGWQAGTSYAPTLASNTTYYWHVKARDGAGNETSYTATWDFTTEVAANNPPDAPADHDQYKADGTTLIAHNGINDSTVLKIKATVTDTNSDDVSLEVEIVLNSGSFTGTPNCSSSYVTSGTVAMATCGSLVDGASYKWRTRTSDGSATSSWQTFGPSDPDVRIVLSGQFDITSCSGCHDYPPADGTARNNPVGAVIGAHSVTEHEADIGNCNKCHLIPGATEYDHREGNIEMSSLIHSQTGSFYDKDQNNTKEAGDSTFAQSNSPTLGNCAATYCHGTDSFQWQTPQLTTYDHCTICHGNATSGNNQSVTAYKRAPGADDVGVDTGGDSINTDPQVGAHEAHLRATSSISSAIACSECHTVPTSLTENGHWDTTGARDAADIIFNGPIGNKDGLDNNLTITYTGGQCSNTYCHDGRNYKNQYSTAAQIDFETPTWNSPMITVPDGDGICDNCHGYPPEPTNGHPNDADCSKCHDHVNATDNGFIGAANIAKHINHQVDAQGECISCHDGIPNGATYVTRAVMTGDFVQSSRHVFGVTPANWDCIVCHREGDETAATSGNVATTSLHGNGGTPVVDMRDVDNISTGWVWDKYDGTCSNGTYDNINDCVDNSATWTWSTDAMLTDMDSFCIGCHDSGGASGIAVDSGGTAITTTPGALASTPFNDALRTANTKGGTAILDDNSDNIPDNYERTSVLDVETQFLSTESHHAVLQQAYSQTSCDFYNGGDYTSNCWGTGAWVNRKLKNNSYLTDAPGGGANDGVFETARLHCADCHTTDQNAHGGAYGFMLQASSIDGTCHLCHNSGVYSNNSSTLTRWSHDKEPNPWDAGAEAKIGVYDGNGGSACMSCHGGDPATDGFGGIHGIPAGSDPRSGEPRYRFQGGSYMSHKPGSWTTTDGTGRGCYFDSGSATVDWAKCNKHSGSELGANKDMDPQYSRGVPGDY